ncbi:MAG: hypothetical protein ACI4SR_07335 [Faecalibacillus sp.]
MEKEQFEDKQIGLVLSLKKLQFTDDEISLFIHNSNLQKVLILKRQRKKMIEKAHEYYQFVDLIDYMINEYQGGEKNG